MYLNIKYLTCQASLFVCRIKANTRLLPSYK